MQMAAESALSRAGKFGKKLTNNFIILCELLAGVALRHPEFSFVVRAASIAAFMLLTTAVAAHVIARAAARSGTPIWKGTQVDERPSHMTDRDAP